jgi:hypothetical protein
MQLAEQDYDRLYVVLRSSFPSQKPAQPPERIGIVFASWALLGYTFTSSHPVNAIVDGQRLPLCEARAIDTRMINGKYVSSIMSFVDFESFMKLVTGKTVEMKVGKFIFTLTDHHKQKLKEFASKVQPQAVN